MMHILDKIGIVIITCIAIQASTVCKASKKELPKYFRFWRNIQDRATQHIVIQHLFYQYFVLFFQTNPSDAFLLLHSMCYTFINVKRKTGKLGQVCQKCKF